VSDFVVGTADIRDSSTWENGVFASVLSVVVVLACLAGAGRADEPASKEGAPMNPDTNPSALKASLPPVVVYPAPQGEKLSDDFELRVAGLPVPVYQCRVSAVPFDQAWPGYQRPLDQTELASFAYWDEAGAADVVVVSRRPVESVAVRPASRGIRAQVDKDRITFRMPGPGQATVEVNGWHKALHLFANPPAGPAPKTDAPGVRYFGPGVHQAGKIMMESNQTVYIAGGAVVYGSVQAVGAGNVKVLGRGILDTSEIPRGQGGGCVRFTNSQEITVDGVILRDPDVYGLSTYTCSKVTFSNVKLIGLWRYNSDGIDIHNSQDVVVRNCFVRSFDDSLVIKGITRRGATESKPVQRVLFEGCVVWNDWGRALEVGAETSAPEMTDITYRDIDIIRTSFIALDIQHSDRAAIRNVRFEDIRLEVDDVCLDPLIQNGPDDKYPAQPKVFVPRLLVVEIKKTGVSRDDQRGTAEGVTVRNVSVTGKPFPTSLLHGFDAEHQVKGVIIENLRINGKGVKSLEEAAVKVDPFVQDVKIVAP
jgi:hypothetical protein